MSKLRINDETAKSIVDLAREQAYESSTYEKGIVTLFKAGIEDFNICKKILDGKLTLKTVIIDDLIHYDTIPDSWTPPDINSMKKEVEKFINEMFTEPILGKKAIECIDKRGLIFYQCWGRWIKQLLKYNVKEAYFEMKKVDALMLETTSSITRIEKMDLIRSMVFHGYCEDKECKYCKKDQKICLFKERNTLGCYALEPMIEEKLDENAKRIQEKIFNPRYDSEGKIYKFDLGKYNFSYKNNARDQSFCPHCNNPTKAKYIIHPVIDDLNNNGKFEFLGIKHLNNDSYAVCFKCLKCGELLFYHYPEHSLKNMLNEFPEIKNKIYGGIGEN